MDFDGHDDEGEKVREMISSQMEQVKLLFNCVSLKSNLLVGIKNL